MEFENEDFNVIVPDYLINENEATSEENEATSEENEATSEENEAASEENEAASEENEAASEENEATSEENEAASEEVDYSSILQEMNSRLENIEANTSVDYTEGINGLLANIYFIDFVAFAVFVFLMLWLVIKFFKQFF